MRARFPIPPAWSLDVLARLAPLCPAVLAAVVAVGAPAGRAAPLVAQAPQLLPAPSSKPAAQAASPRVNLAVEWRWSETALRRPAAPGAAGAGAVVTSTQGSTAPPQGQVTVRVGAHATASALPALPARVVLANGGGARVRLAEAVPLHAVQAWREGSVTGAALVPGWAEAAQALELHVRWPGGRAAAEVELEVEQAMPPSADGTAPRARRERLATRAFVPLGEWVTVAAFGDASGGASGADATTVSTSALEARAARVLQLRLSVMP